VEKDMNHPEDYVMRILKVLVYIEDHIDDEISMDELAKVACHSPFHFHRIFHMVESRQLSQFGLQPFWLNLLN
jgi:AraC family transcriptional regulator